MKAKFWGAGVMTGVALLLAVAGTLLVTLSPEAWAAEASGGGVPASVQQWGFLAAALSTGLSALAAGYAVGSVGAAAVGAVAENPDLLGRMLIFVGLAEGIAIYGLIVSILILNQIT